jgi:hypothetical protein
MARESYWATKLACSKSATKTVVKRMSDEQLEAELRRLPAELDLSASPVNEGKLDA